MKNKPAKKRCPHCPERCFCGSTEDLENNHLGGRRHVPWLTIPFCKKDHAVFHLMCQRAGIDFHQANTWLLGQVQALKAQLVGMWMVIESIEESVKKANKGETK